MRQLHQSFLSHLPQIAEWQITGTVSSIRGLLIECSGIHHVVSIGSRCVVIARNGRKVITEVVGMHNTTALLMPFTNLEGIGVGCVVEFVEDQSVLYPDLSWQGRILNAMAEPIDNGGPLMNGVQAYPYKASPPPAQKRRRVRDKMDVGVRAMNTFLTCCRGQRMGIFAGSGVGKSMLIAMLTKYCDTDIKVIGLIGERGREVQEFVEDYLGPEGLKRAVIIVATSDETALMRRQAAYLTLAVAEYFRDQGKQVLCLMDSVTRFAMAQREIGLSAGEPPASKGYTPSVFAELPRLLERAGTGEGEGAITGLFSVLVEGDDHNEPIADTVRGILDGHIILDRTIAQRGRFPAIDILRSVSRTMPHCNTEAETAVILRARALLSTYNDMAEMIRLGAYKKGSDPQVDEAIKYFPALEKFLSQAYTIKSEMEIGYQELAELLGMTEVQMGTKGSVIPAEAGIHAR